MGTKKIIYHCYSFKNFNVLLMILDTETDMLKLQILDFKTFFWIFLC